MLILLGLIGGYVLSGGLDAGPEQETTAQASVTSTEPIAAVSSSTTQPTFPDTTSPTSTLATVPEGTPMPTIPPDFSVEGAILYTAGADTYVDGSLPDAVFGFGPSIVVENDPPATRYSLISFEVSGLNDGDAVTRAILSLYVQSASGDPVTIHDVDGSWSESETNAQNAPQIGNLIATIPTIESDLVYVEVDVTDSIQGNGTADFYLATSSDHTTDFASRESATPPRLTVEFSE